MRFSTTSSLAWGSSTVVGRDAILKDSRQRREERQQVKKEEQAALTIQRVWRGKQTRSQFRSELVRAWTTQNARHFSRPCLTRTEMLTLVLPPMLWVCLGPKPAQGGDRSAPQRPPFLHLDAPRSKALSGMLMLTLYALRSSDPDVALLRDCRPRSRHAWLMDRLGHLLAACVSSPNCGHLVKTAALRCLTCMLQTAAESACREDDTTVSTPLSWAPGPQVMTGLIPQTLRLVLQNQTMPAEQRSQAATSLLDALLQLWRRRRPEGPGADAVVGGLVREVLSQVDLDQLRPVRTQLAAPDIQRAVCSLVSAEWGESALLGGAGDARPAAARLLLTLGELARVSGTDGEKTPAAGFLSSAKTIVTSLFSQTAGPGGPDAARKVFVEAGYGPFAQAGILGALLQKGRAADDVVADLAFVWWSVLGAQEASSAHRIDQGVEGDLPSAQGSHPHAPLSPMLNYLAFGLERTTLLRTLWRRTAAILGVAPAMRFQRDGGGAGSWDATSVAALLPAARAQRSADLSHAQETAALFAVVYVHLLHVLDDVEFAAAGGAGNPFSLDEVRAICAVFNSLVVRYLLLADGGAAPPSGARNAGPGQLLPAAIALQSALFERDARCSFCPAVLWVAPARAVLDGGSQLATRMPAVLRAMEAHAEPGERSPGAALATLLLRAPQCIPFDDRVGLLRDMISEDRARLRLDVSPAEGGPRPLEFTVRRSSLLEDGIGALLGCPPEHLKRRFCVTFVNAFGQREAGIDMGGLQKEFIDRFVADVLDLRRGLFAATSDGARLFPSPMAPDLEGGWAALEAAGIAVGKALYEGLLVSAPLAPSVMRHLLGLPVPTEELAVADPELYRSLMKLKTYDADMLDELGLDFTVESDHFGRHISEDLVPGGSQLRVTVSNRLLYIHAVAYWHLTRRLGPAADAFGRGLFKIVPARWLRLFSPKELNQLLGGASDSDIDIEDLRQHTQYSGGYTASSSTIKAFWSCMRQMTPQETVAVLKFATAMSRPPLGGFQYLVPPFTIHKVASDASVFAIFGAKDVDRLPSSSTCANTLKLPDFRRASTLRDKLRYAIHSGAGFDLS